MPRKKSSASAKSKTGTKRQRRKAFKRLGAERRKANDRERERANRQSEAMEDLRCTIWKDPNDIICSTIVILRTAIGYMSLLKEVVDAGELPEQAAEETLPALTLLLRNIETNMLTEFGERRYLQGKDSDVGDEDEDDGATKSSGAAGAVEGDDWSEANDTSTADTDVVMFVESKAPADAQPLTSPSAPDEVPQARKDLPEFLSVVNNLGHLPQDQLAARMSQLPRSQYEQLRVITSTLLAVDSSGGENPSEQQVSDIDLMLRAARPPSYTPAIDKQSRGGRRCAVIQTPTSSRVRNRCNGKVVSHNALLQASSRASSSATSPTSSVSMSQEMHLAIPVPLHDIMMPQQQPSAAMNDIFQAMSSRQAMARQAPHADQRTQQHIPLAAASSPLPPFSSLPVQAGLLSPQQLQVTTMTTGTATSRNSAQSGLAASASVVGCKNGGFMADAAPWPNHETIQ
eukprot:scpid82439/ scgid6428/ 